ncbi:MAG: MOSC domain-containing protein [Acidimicrobiales bacterium]
MGAPGSVSALYRFPVKSMQGERVERLMLEKEGAKGDRLFGVLDVATGKVLSAKRTAALLDATATLDERTGAVAITLPDGSAHEAGDPTTDTALSAWLGREVRLTGPGVDATAYELLMDPVDDSSEVWDFATPAGSLVDLAGAHLLTTASLGAAAALRPGADWSIHRFRPTVLIDTGEAEGFVEDAWVGATVALGAASVEVFMATPRCSMPPRAQPPNGLEREVEVASILRDHHENNLGVYATITTAGTVAVGDAVTI